VERESRDVLGTVFDMKNRYPRACWMYVTVYTHLGRVRVVDQRGLATQRSNAASDS
jgi:hypothetical protein